MTLRRSRWYLVLLMSIAVALGSSIREAIADQPGESLKELLDLYRTYQLPLPPDGAKLVRIESGARSVDNKRRETPLGCLGFLIKPARADHPAAVLIGTREKTFSSKLKIMPVEPDPAFAKDPTITDTEYRFGLDSNLAFSLQCQARGWDGLARAWIENRPVRVIIPEGTRATRLSLRQSLLSVAWMHWVNALYDPGADWTRIAERMKALREAAPNPTPGERDILTCLQEALEPSKAMPGSIEAMIDDLVKVSSTGAFASLPDPEFVKLEQLGFEAVPALIAHWDDPRLARFSHPAVMMSKGWPGQVYTLVRELIGNLAGRELTGKPNIEKADVLAWWAKAQLAGEENYLVAHVLPTEEKEEWANGTILRIIGKKYPSRLPILYRTILEKRPHIHSDDFIKAINESSLPREVKRELFLQGANDKNLEHRSAALWGLRELDPQRFLKLLIATLESLPTTPSEPYWKCREASFANLVMETDDPTAWSTLEKVAKRSDVGLRMEFMNPMSYTYIRGRNRRQRLEFLSQFLDDDTVRDVKSNPKQFDGPHAAFHVAKIEVRNFAAWKLGSILRMDVEPDGSWTPERWTELRDRVRQAVARELSAKSERGIR